MPASIELALKASGIPLDSTAILVQEAGADRPVVAHNVERPMNPASVMKLVTTYAGLEMLGPAFTWRTDVLAVGSVRDGTLEGDLLIRGQGDPKLTLENFWLLLRGVHARGVHDIRGDLVLDRSYYGVDGGDPGRFDNEPTQVYNTLPDALLVNFKAVRLTFVPDIDNKRVHIVTEPALPEVQIVNHVVLDNAPCGDWRARIRPEIRAESTAARLIFAGQLSAQCGEQARHYSILSPQTYAGALFRQLWGELGGRFAGTIREGLAPAHARPIASQTSPALAEIVRDINKYSNNAMARQVYLALGAAAFAAPATAEKSERALRQWLAQKRLDLPELVVENGSGLSRIERISARSLGALLAAAWRSAVMPEFIASMPVVGVDGTLRRRGKQLAYAGQAHIKGGTINGVRAMAGYVLDASGRRWIVVCMINHPKVHNGNAHAVFDALLQWAHSRGGTLPAPASEGRPPVD
ncbi:MAG: D-alanyl-D-alanine carboxypeptidase/D-alanyl-D-alanine-endopeptidase [Burkholderiales bacterium]|nr:D-alanyl-D-alanine carboxypeptidase/D-alanyl-D-alanine-endopeptidase [Burkholderiales bacterium]